MTTLAPTLPQATPTLFPLKTLMNSCKDTKSPSVVGVCTPPPPTAPPQGSATPHLNLVAATPPQSLQQVRTQGLILAKGQAGPAVRELQIRLAQVGYGVAATGVYGASTEQMVKQFQKDTGLSANGKVGPTTLKTLDTFIRQGNNPLAKKLAHRAHQEARKRGTIGWCYNAVATVIEANLKPFLYGEHAYQSANQFARHPRFREIKPPSDMTTLPVGAVVVWGKGSSPSGHISVYVGQGLEASDHIEAQMQSHYGGGKPRVFVAR